MGFNVNRIRFADLKAVEDEDGKLRLLFGSNGLTELYISRNLDKKKDKDPDFILYLDQDIRALGQYYSSFCSEVGKMIQDGCDLDTVASLLGIDMPTLLAWREKYPEFDKTLSDN